MDMNTIIRQLEYEADKHKNDRLFTGQINITAMCRDLIPKMKELKRYEDLKQDGRLLELPCKAGDILYKPTRNFVSKYRIVFIEVSTCNNIFLHTRVIEGINDTGEVFGGDSIGKTVFLTKEAAETALKEMEEQV